MVSEKSIEALALQIQDNHNEVKEHLLKLSAQTHDETDQAAFYFTAIEAFQVLLLLVILWRIW
jgi:hypothetical protein